MGPIMGKLHELQISRFCVPSKIKSTCGRYEIVWIVKDPLSLTVMHRALLIMKTAASLVYSDDRARRVTWLLTLKKKGKLNPKVP